MAAGINGVSGMKISFKKVIWAMRAVIYKPLFQKIKMPSYIGNPIYIEGKKRINIGKRVRIFPGARMEALQNGKITIEDNVYLGQNIHITSENSELIIGAGSSAMANVCITNIDHNYDSINIPVLEQGYTTRETIIGKNCFIGHGAVIQAGVELMDHVIVGANSVVCRGEYPVNCVIAGAPARIVKRYDAESQQWIKV